MTLEEALAELKNPDAQARVRAVRWKVLSIANGTKSRYHKGQEAVDMAKLTETETPARATRPEEWAEHVARVKAARGKFAWVRTTSEEFSRRKQEEIDLEEEKSERRMR